MLYVAAHLSATVVYYLYRKHRARVLFQEAINAQTNVVRTAIGYGER